MESKVLILKKIFKSYKNKQVLENINFSLNKGDFFGLVGQNGAGKSTLLSIIGGLVLPSSGQVTLFGQTRKKTTTLKNISIINSDAFYDYLSPIQNLKYFARLKGIKGKTEIERVIQLLDINLEVALVKDLSIINRRKLALAGALMGYPDLLLLDEPFVGLDSQSQTHLKKVLLQINQHYQTTILITSQQLSEIEKLINCVGFIANGKLVKIQSSNELLAKGSPILQLTTLDNDKTLACLKDKFPHVKIGMNLKSDIQVICQYEQIPNIIATLVQASCPIIKAQPIYLDKQEESYVQLLSQ